MNTTITFQTNDNKEIEFYINIAKLMIIVKSAMEDADDDGVMPLPNINSNILEKVMDYGKMWLTMTDEQKNDIKQATNNHTEWEKKYFDIPQETVFELIIAANYLQMQILLDASCKFIASLISGKTTEELREIFNIENDYTPDEEQAMKEENAWAYE